MKITRRQLRKIIMKEARLIEAGQEPITLQGMTVSIDDGKIVINNKVYQLQATNRFIGTQNVSITSITPGEGTLEVVGELKDGRSLPPKELTQAQISAIIKNVDADAEHFTIAGKVVDMKFVNVTPKPDDGMA